MHPTFVAIIVVTTVAIAALIITVTLLFTVYRTSFLGKVHMLTKKLMISGSQHSSVGLASSSDTLCHNCYSSRLLSTYRHPENFYTEGFFFSSDGNVLYESTGLQGKSVIAKIIPETGQVIQSVPLPPNVFGEGSSILNGILYQLTYKNGIVFKRNPETLRVLSQTVDYQREGWGLTTDGTSLIASDGTNTIYYMDEDLKVIRTLSVNRDGLAVQRLNELEYMPKGTLSADRDLILTNEWLTSLLLAIDVETGDVVAVWDLSELFPPFVWEETDDGYRNVLNGVARRPTDPAQIVWVTGKRWPLMYRIFLSFPNKES